MSKKKIRNVSAELKFRHLLQVGRRFCNCPAFDSGICRGRNHDGSCERPFQRIHAGTLRFQCWTETVWSQRLHDRYGTRCPSVWSTSATCPTLRKCPFQHSRIALGAAIPTSHKFRFLIPNVAPAPVLWSIPESWLRRSRSPIRQIRRYRGSHYRITGKRLVELNCRWEKFQSFHRMAMIWCRRRNDGGGR